MKSKNNQEVSDSNSSNDGEIFSRKLKATFEKSKSKKTNDHDNKDHKNDSKTLRSKSLKVSEKNDYTYGSGEKNVDFDIGSTGEKAAHIISKVDHNLKKNVKNESDAFCSTFNIEELTSDDEVYTFQCPNDFDKHDLCNKILDFTQTNKLQSSKSNESFKLEILNSEKKFITLAMPNKTRNGCLMNLPLSGHILIEKIINLPDIQNISLPENELKTNIMFPEDLKMRHPLLGVDWKTVIKNINAAITSQKRKLKKEKNVTTEEKPSEMSKKKSKRSLPDLNNSHHGIKKKKL